MPPRPLDARALAALAANPGCRRRALLDGAGVDKGALASALGAPAAFGQSQFAFVRGNAFEARVVADGGAELIRLLCAHTDGTPATPPEPAEVTVPDLAADGPAGRTARTRIALEEATAAGRWALLRHPMVSLEIAGSAAYLEPDAIAVRPDGGWTVIEIKSFPILDGSADPAKVGAAARQAAVYALALEQLPGGAGRVRSEALLVCPKDFSNLPTAAPVDLRKQLASTRRQLKRLTRLDEIADTVPDGTRFDPALPGEELTAAVDTVPAEYAPECLASCELAFHCRAQARTAGTVASLGRAVRGELGGLTTVDAVLTAAHGEGADAADAADAPDATDAASADAADTAGPVDDPAAAALRRAARLRAEALEHLEHTAPPAHTAAPAHTAPPVRQSPDAEAACR
ncbi:hypothetical protein [Streptomyces armeniacus]|uniref:hypothetical protein n=1 Tax=Streptomyces armeniacus TaxID=83291 RepID=UPI00269C268E